MFSIQKLQNYHFAPHFSLFPFSVNFSSFQHTENMIHFHNSLSNTTTHNLTLISIHILFPIYYSVCYTENKTYKINRKCKMQKEILKSKGEDVETLYLANIYSGELNSSVNQGQRRWTFKPQLETCIKTLSTASSTTFPSAAPSERL